MNRKCTYGYKHWTLEESPRCFNVGKGLIGRPHSHKNRNHKWHAVVKRYGLRVEVCVGPVTNEEACAWEVEHIAQERTFSVSHSHDDMNDIGCNFTRGGECGFQPTENQRKEYATRMSALRRATPPWNKGKKTGKLAWNRGLPLSVETLKKISDALRGKSPSCETRDKLRQASLGKKRPGVRRSWERNVPSR